MKTALPAGSTLSWRLFAGDPPRAFEPRVRVRTDPRFLEITNGITGIRIARVDKSHSSLAPIQGILLRTGEWSATGPNYLSAPLNSAHPPQLEARTANLRIVESGPLRARVEVEYTYDRPALIYSNRILIPAGSGYFRSTITLEAGSPSVMVEDDTDMDLEYTLDFYKQIEPDTGRYRGHHATDPLFGREPGGRIYGPFEDRPRVDAERDFDYRVPVWSAYITGDYGSYSLLARTAMWNPWIADSGWYWMMYNRSAGSNAPVIGIYPGAASRLLGAGNSGPGFMFLPGEPARNRIAAICLQMNRRTPDGQVFPRVRVPWAIFVGIKGKDIGDPREIQSIAREADIHAGINLNKVYRYQLAWPDPPGGLQPLYMPRESVLRIADRVRNSPEFYRHLYDAEPSARPLYDMWRDTTGAKAGKAASAIFNVARDWLDAEVNGDGIHDFRFEYWHGGLAADSAAPILNELLAIEPVSQTMRARLKAAAALFGYLLWDEDLAPLSGNAGVNLGTPNMPVQQYQYRHLYAVMLSGHPAMKQRSAEAAAEVAKGLEIEINPSGAHRASPHYASASIEPLLDAAQQIRMAGLGNLFASEPRIAKFAEFYMQLLTPPEARFGGVRKLVSIGDGSTESSSLFGVMGTYLAAENPDLSARLMAAWRASGSPHSGFHGTTVLKIDEDLPASRLKLASSEWPGWCSVLRSGFNTAVESAVWFVNGDFYSDHRHADQGSISIYALGSPLALDWGSMYSPHAAGPYMHSLVLPESALKRPWSAEPELDEGDMPWIRSTQDGFTDFEDATWSAASFDAANGSKWTRSVALIHPDELHPMILISDKISGPFSSGARISTLNMMARDAVITPGGPVMPPLRLYDFSRGRGELPSATSPAPLREGLSRFQFRGQFGVDWDLYTIASGPQHFLLGAWAHGWHPSAETAEFEKTNRRQFEESQYALRIRGSGPLLTLILPRRQGTQPVVIKESGAGFEYRIDADAEGAIGESFHAYRSRTQTTLAAFDQRAVSAYGISISGGPAEVKLKYGHAFLAITGLKGRREFHIPGNWELNSSVIQGTPGVIEVDFDGRPVYLTLSPKTAN